jgi:hypothetical protein
MDKLYNYIFGDNVANYVHFTKLFRSRSDFLRSKLRP